MAFRTLTLGIGMLTMAFGMLTVGFGTLTMDFGMITMISGTLPLDHGMISMRLRTHTGGRGASYVGWFAFFYFRFTPK